MVERETHTHTQRQRSSSSSKARVLLLKTLSPDTVIVGVRAWGGDTIQSIAAGMQPFPTSTFLSGGGRSKGSAAVQSQPARRGANSELSNAPDSGTFLLGSPTVPGRALAATSLPLPRLPGLEVN